MNPIKKMATRRIDDKVLNKINELEKIIQANFKKWYRSTLSNTIVIITLVLIGVFHYFFTTNTAIVKLVVAIAYLASIGIFVKRRVQNIQTLIKNRVNIKKYRTLIKEALAHSHFGERTRAVAYTIYQDFYTEKTSSVLKKIHSVTSFLHVTPNKDETFEIIYVRMKEFFREFLLMQMVRYGVFILLFASISIFVKNSVILEMKFSSVFETIFYPFLYFLEFFSLP